MDVAVHMAFGSKVQNSAGAVLGQHAVHQSSVAQVAFNEVVARVALQAGDILQIACVGEFVEVDDRLIRLASQSSTKLLPIKPAPPVTNIINSSRSYKNLRMQEP